MPGRKSTDVVQLKLRLREELRRKIEREAKKNDLSLNNEIVRRLESSFDYEAWQSQRLTLLTTLDTVMKSSPETAAKLEAVAKELEESDEQAFQKMLLDTLRPAKQPKP